MLISEDGIPIGIIDWKTTQIFTVKIQMNICGHICAQVMVLIVAEEFRRNGVGRSLMQELLLISERCACWGG